MCVSGVPANMCEEVGFGWGVGPVDVRFSHAEKVDVVGGKEEANLICFGFGVMVLDAIDVLERYTRVVGWDRGGDGCAEFGIIGRWVKWCRRLCGTCLNGH